MAELRAPKPKGLVPVGEFQDLAKRGISAATCRAFGYFVRRGPDGPEQVAPYYTPDGELVAQKVRTPDKDFEWRGKAKRAALWGQHLWTPRGDGKGFLVITEGEIDCLSVAEAWSRKYAVVSIKSGAPNAAQDIAKQIEWLEQWPSIVLCFDMDDEGREAAKECAEILTPGKVRIARLPLKDANEMLKAHRSRELIDALFDAPVYKPDGVVNGADLLAKLEAPPARARVPFPWPKVQDMTGGMWPGSIITIGAGTNAGKTPLVYNLEYHLLSLGETIGVLHTEQQAREAALGLLQLHEGRRLDPGIAHTDIKAAHAKVFGDGRWHYFTVDESPQELMSKARYLIHACGCGWIIVDQLTDIIDAFTGADERRFIDNIMSDFKALAVRHNVGIILVSQLTRPQGNQSWEHGAQVAMHRLRGSNSLASKPAIILGYERDLQAEGSNALLGYLRVLKARHGRTGPADALLYDETSGRLVPVDGQTGEVYGFKDEGGPPPPF